MMNHNRTTCITLTLLLLAVSFAFVGCAGDRRADDSSQAPSASPSGTLTPAVAPGDGSCIASGTEDSLTTTEAQALDAQLKAIEDELESLEVPEDQGTAAIEEGLN